jgi:hypothetical protein
MDSNFLFVIKYNYLIWAGSINSMNTFSGEQIFFTDQNLA